MLSILDIYERAFYWHIFVPAPRWHRDTAAVRVSGAGVLRGAGEAEVNGLPPRKSSAPEAGRRGAGSGVVVSAPVGRRGIDVTV